MHSLSPDWSPYSGIMLSLVRFLVAEKGKRKVVFDCLVVAIDCNEVNLPFCILVCEVDVLSCPMLLGCE